MKHKRADIADLPQTIEIASRRITIEADDDCEDFGEWDANSQTITYAPEQAIAQLRDTIWHEVLHAVIEDINGDKMGENPLRRAATMTLHALRHNPELRKFLFGDLEAS